MVKKFDPRTVLPPELRIPYSGQHFYRYGFSLYRNGSTSRSPLYHPLLVFIGPSLMTTKFMYLYMTPDHSSHFHRVMGDFGYFMNLKKFMNISLVLVYLMAILSQIVHFYEYKRNTKSTYMRVFDMMCGTVTPQSIGLYDQNIIERLLRRTRLFFKLNEANRFFTTLMGFLLSSLAFVTQFTFVEMLFIGIPHTFFYTLGTHYITNVVSTQMVYFSILSYYLKLKQRQVNGCLRKLILSKRIIRMNDTIRVMAKLNQIYSEIEECDSNFWSKFLAIIWTTSTTIIANSLFMFAFGDKATLVIRVLALYGGSLILVVILIVISTAGSVNNEAKQTYKLLASYKFLSMATKQTRVYNARHGFKVCILIIFLYDLVR